MKLLNMKLLNMRPSTIVIAMLLLLSIGISYAQNAQGVSEPKDAGVNVTKILTGSANSAENEAQAVSSIKAAETEAKAASSTKTSGTNVQANIQTTGITTAAEIGNKATSSAEMQTGKTEESTEAASQGVSEESQEAVSPVFTSAPGEFFGPPPEIFFGPGYTTPISYYTGPVSYPVAIAPIAPVTSTTGSITPYLIVYNQTVVGNTISIAEAASNGPGWVAVFDNIQGRPGGIVGWSHVNLGLNTNVIVPIDLNISTKNLFAVLLADRGNPGVFEFPTPDTYAMANGKPVIVAFTISPPAQAATPTTAPTNVTTAPVSATTAPVNIGQVPLGGATPSVTVGASVPPSPMAAGTTYPAGTTGAGY